MEWGDGGVRVAGIRGCNIGNIKPLIWKHLTDWHFILQKTMEENNECDM